MATVEELLPHCVESENLPSFVHWQILWTSSWLLSRCSCRQLHTLGLWFWLEACLCVCVHVY